MGRVWVDHGAAAAAAAEAARDAVVEETNRLRNELVRRTPRDSGRTASGWDQSVRVEGARAVGEVFNRVRADSGRYVWEYLHEGTGRFGPSGRDIVPVRRRVLRWRARGAMSRSSGGYVFARRSSGSPPDTFIVDAVVSSEWTVTRLVPAGSRVPGA